MSSAPRGIDIRSATMADDLPPGPWSALLIGHHWPAAATLTVLRAGAGGREMIQATHDSYAETLASIAEQRLAGQRGVTADSARASYEAGQRRARGIAERNRIKRESYRSAIATTEALRDDLNNIAEKGNAAIENIRSSQASASAKVSAIADVIAESHAQAASRSALHASSLYSAVQAIVEAEALAPSAQAFASAHGLAFTDTHAPDAQAIEEQVRAAVVAP